MVWYNINANTGIFFRKIEDSAKKGSCECNYIILCFCKKILLSLQPKMENKGMKKQVSGKSVRPEWKSSHRRKNYPLIRLDAKFVNDWIAFIKSHCF